MHIAMTYWFITIFIVVSIACKERQTAPRRPKQSDQSSTPLHTIYFRKKRIEQHDTLKANCPAGVHKQMPQHTCVIAKCHERQER